MAIDGAATLAGTVRLDLPTGTPAARFLADDGTNGTFTTVRGSFTLRYGARGVTATPAG